MLDNVDQRDPKEQLSVFLLAHELCKNLDAIIFVALREESFFRAEQSGVFNAYHNIRYHISSPNVRDLLAKRIDYALIVSGKGADALRIALRSGAEFDANEIKTFLYIIKDSVLKHNPALYGSSLKRLVTVICDQHWECLTNSWYQGRHMLRRCWIYIRILVDIGLQSMNL